MSSSDNTTIKETSPPKEKQKLFTIKEFIELSEFSFNDRNKFAYQLSYKNEDSKSIEEWKNKLKLNGN